MIFPEIKIRGMKQAIGSIDALDVRVTEAVATLIRKTGILIAKDAKGAAPRRTGKYARSFRSRFNRRELLARVAPWLGNRPHPIGHLLEKGHKIAGGNFASAFVVKQRGSRRVTGHVGGGRVAGRPHLFPAADRAIADFGPQLRGLIGA